MLVSRLIIRRAEAACSVHGSPFGAGTTSRLLADFQELRQGFSPPTPWLLARPHLEKYLG